MKATVGVVSLGCSKNRVDTEQMLGLLRAAGYEIVSDPAQAQVLIVNTCGFIGPAKEESIETLFEMAQYKQTGRCELLVATGCFAQRYPQAVREEMPEVDAILGVGQYDKLIAALDEASRHLRPVYVESSTGFLECGRVLTTPPYSAYVKIGDGCDNRCSYCAIPLIRGRYRSRPQADVVREVRELAAQGVSEITLVAQDTTRYGTDLTGGRSLLPELMEAVSQVEGVRFLRTLYSYPDLVDARLLDTLERLPNACRYIDLPIQHISQELLTRMNRRGTSEHIRRIVAEIRRRGMALRTTVMVGFPGETQAQFDELLDFLREAQFDRLGAFAFSPEDDTPAALMPDQVPEEVKQERLDRVMRLQQGISLARGQLRVGTTCAVLVEGRDAQGYFGRSQFEAPETDGLIRFSCPRELAPGNYVDVRITRALEYDLIGACV